MKGSAVMKELKIAIEESESDSSERQSIFLLIPSSDFFLTKLYDVFSYVLKVIFLSIVSAVKSS